MGLFDRFKKNTEQEVVKEQPKNELPFEVSFRRTPDGRIQIDFYDKQADFNQFYDTTRLIANPNPTSLGNDRDVLNCLVSWYGREDADILENGREMGRKTQYRGILAQIDLKLLQTDANYCSMVMKGLLNEKRVESYLDRGLQENPELPCGKYIGGVKEQNNQYKKVFNSAIGRQSHYSELMVNRRREMQRRQDNAYDYER